MADTESEQSVAPPPPAAAAAAAAAGAAAVEDTQVNRCLVYLRVRPDNARDYSEPGSYPLLTLNKAAVNVDKERQYNFDGTFGQDCHQEDIFEAVGKPGMDHCIKGGRGSILCYGQTGTGKSFTMLGKMNTPQAGLIPRCAQYLFSEIEARSADTEFSVEMQYVQLYRSESNDLMSESHNQRFDVHFDNATGVTLPGCTSHLVNSAEQMMTLFEAASVHRVTVATAMNPESSRGHAALVVWIMSKSKAVGNCEQRKGKMTFIDLAGYERFSKTGISNSDPIRKDEAKCINSSLLSLGHVVTSLSNGEKHIPWRNAKLTRLLQDSIGGRSRTSLLLTASPTSDSMFETQNTLQLGERAMAVRVQSKVRVVMDWEKHAKKLEAMLEEKQRRIDELQQQLANCAAAESELILRQQKDIDALKEKHVEALAAMQEEGADEERLRSLRHQQELETELLYTQQAEERAYQEQKIEEEEEQQRVAAGEGEAEAGTASEQHQDNNAPPLNLSFDGDTMNINKTKDELIADLKRQVRLYRMKLMVPEKYRAASETVEHEALAGTTTAGRTAAALDAMAAESAANNSFAAGALGPNATTSVSVQEFEAMRKTLEAELENRDALLAQKLDLQSFAAAVSSSSAESSTTSGSAGVKTADDAGHYLASLHRRIADLSDRLESERKLHAQQQQSQSQSREGSSVLFAVAPPVESPSSGGQEAASSSTQNQQLQLQQQLDAFREELEAKSKLCAQLSGTMLDSLASAALDGKERLALAAADLIAEHFDAFSAAQAKYHREVEFLQGELETQKMEMQMVVDGQNESLMEAIETARADAQREFGVKKLSWEEEASSAAEQARQQAADDVRREFQEQTLMHQAEFAKLQHMLLERDDEIAALQEASAAAAEQVAAAQEEVAAAKQLAAEAEANAATATAGTAAPTAGVTPSTAPPAQPATVATASASTATTPSNNNNKPPPPPPPSLPSPAENSSANFASARAASVTPTTTAIFAPTLTQSRFSHQQREQHLHYTSSSSSAATVHLEELDSILMPMLKSKTQLLDDLTEVLASASALDGTFDHIPEIPLMSARGGGGGLLSATTLSSSLDPHASLASFVRAVQQSRATLDEIEAAAAAAAPPSSRHHHRTDSLDDLSSPPMTGTSVKKPLGVPALALGKLSAVAAAPASPAMSVAAGAGPMTARTHPHRAMASLPATLPAVLLRIVKRMRSNASEAETKWMRCVVALAKISKSMSVLAAQQQQQAGAAASSQPNQQQQQQRVGKIAADVMNLVKAALKVDDDGSSSNSSSGNKKGTTSTMQQQQRGLSEAEQARRALAETFHIQRPVVAGEPAMAEQQALQALLKSHQEQLCRADEEVVALAVEVARSKLALRFERQIMLALGETDEDAEARRTIVEFESIAQEQATAAAGAPTEEQSPALSETTARTMKHELTYFKLKAAMLEQKLRAQLAELAKAQQQQQQQQLSHHPTGTAPSTFTPPSSANPAAISGMKTAAMKEQELQREIHAASASIVTDMDLITSCREAELRVLSSRLERVEREFSMFKSSTQQQQRLAGNNNNSNNNQSPAGRTAASSQHSSAGGGGVTASAESVFYHVLRNLRKENSILHSVIRERGLQLRKFAMTLMRHGLLPPAYDTSKLAGDVHSELRLAFAERDEEIFLKDQTLNMRSTQVIVLEEALTALMEQLTRAEMTPCRAPSKFSAELQRARDEIEMKLAAKAKKREELKAKIERVKSELEKVEEKMSLQRQQEDTRGAATAGGGPISTHAQSAAASAADALLVLRLQRDQYQSTRDISEVQLGALESEMALLQQSLMSATSTAALESGIDIKAAEENASVFKKIFGFGGKK